MNVHCLSGGGAAARDVVDGKRNETVTVPCGLWLGRNAIAAPVELSEAVHRNERMKPFVGGKTKESLTPLI